MSTDTEWTTVEGITDSHYLISGLEEASEYQVMMISTSMDRIRRHQPILWQVCGMRMLLLFMAVELLFSDAKISVFF